MKTDVEVDTFDQLIQMFASNLSTLLLKKLFFLSRFSRFSFWIKICEQSWCSPAVGVLSHEHVKLLEFCTTILFSSNIFGGLFGLFLLPPFSSQRWDPFLLSCLLWFGVNPSYISECWEEMYHSVNSLSTPLWWKSSTAPLLWLPGNSSMDINSKIKKTLMFRHYLPSVSNKWWPLCPVSVGHLILVPGWTMVRSSRMCRMKQIWSPNSSFLVSLCVYMLASCVPVNQQIWVSACCSTGRRSRLNSWRSEPLSNNKSPSWSTQSSTSCSLSSSVTAPGKNVLFFFSLHSGFSIQTGIFEHVQVSWSHLLAVSTHQHHWMADVQGYLLHLSGCCLS